MIFTNFEKDNYSAWKDREQNERESHKRIEAVISGLSELNDNELIIVGGIDERQIVQRLEIIHSSEMIDAIKLASASCKENETKTTPFDVEQAATYTPIDDTTYYSALHSIDAAIKAAKALKEGKKLSFSLSRPPGHHAGRNFYHGFCYFNNAAAATLILREGSKKVAILDIDVHHGDGTQDIFYEDPNVVFVSLHADPSRILPHSGLKSEKGSGVGYGTTINFPFDIGISANDYKDLLTRGTREVVKFQPSYLVLSAGFDTHRDEFKHLPSLTLLNSEDYFDLGKIIGTVNLPTCVVLEGGYNTEVLGKAFMNLAKGLE